MVTETVRQRPRFDVQPLRHNPPEPSRERRPAAGHAPALHRFLASAGFPLPALAQAWARARALGCPYEDALYAEGEIEEVAVVRALAERLGFATTDGGALEALAGQAYELAASKGVLRLADGRIAIEARGAGLALALSGALRSGDRRRLVLMARRDLTALALAADGERAASKASGDLGRAHPRFCAVRLRLAPHHVACASLASIAAGLAVAANPVRTTQFVLWLACVFFLAVACLRLAAALTPLAPTPRRPRMHEISLPTMTVLVPLAKEDVAVSGLLVALHRLDYPRAKLDIKLLVEEDDATTLKAVGEFRLPGQFELVRIPSGSPRTKPRALNVGLALARGDFTVVYDAEDRPAPGQLRDMVACFAEGKGDLASKGELAVVQARLVIDMAQKGLLASLFRTEYAGLFAVMLPALATMGFPLPLGGTSNCFRTAVLREVGGWDAYNVTEDADIGLRLFRLGYRAATLASATEEEAPRDARAWLRQRRRWLKGWMVTLLVHASRPASLLRECGSAGALAFFVLTGGIVISALLEPVAIAIIVCHVLDGSLVRSATSIADALEHVAFTTCLIAGHGAAASIGLVGLARLGLPLRPIHLLALPFYWLALSLAAWSALRELVVKPFHWEKTTHFLARMPARLPAER